MHAGIAARGITHVYKPRSGQPLVALDDLSLDVPPGMVLSLMGPNGAGKTTLVRILSTLLLPTQGAARVGGADIVREPKRVRAACGVSFGGDLGLYTRLSARDNLRYFATMYRLGPKAARDRIKYLLELVGLTDRADDRVENFSRGMRQRLHLARAVLHDPPVLMLDEPSAGLDPQGARDLRELVRRLANEGRAILLTTHDLDEAEALSAEVMVLVEGRVQAHASPAALREEASRRLGTCLEVSPALDGDAVWPDGVPGLLRRVQEESRTRLYTTDAAAATGYVLQHLDGAASIQVSKPSLAEAYLSVVQE